MRTNKVRLLVSLALVGSVILLPGCAREKVPENVEYSPPAGNEQSKPMGSGANDALGEKDVEIADDSNNGPDAGEFKIDFSEETVGAEPDSFAGVVGYWSIGTEEDNKLLIVDGSQWEEGKASAGLAEKAKALYGERYAEFLDNVKAYSYFPLAVAKGIDNFQQGEISLRFRPVDGRIDQAAGIVFDLKPNGDYLILRANALEENLVLFKYEQGKRSSVEWVRNTPTPSGQWQELKLKVSGKSIEGYIDGKLYLQHELEAPVDGKVGVWSKADSVVYFDEFTVKHQ